MVCTHLLYGPVGSSLLGRFGKVCSKFHQHVDTKLNLAYFSMQKVSPSPIYIRGREK